MVKHTLFLLGGGVEVITLIGLGQEFSPVCFFPRRLASTTVALVSCFIFFRTRDTFSSSVVTVMAGLSPVAGLSRPLPLGHL